MQASHLSHRTTTEDSSGMIFKEYTIIAQTSPVIQQDSWAKSTFSIICNNYAKILKQIHTLIASGQRYFVSVVLGRHSSFLTAPFQLQEFRTRDAKRCPHHPQ